MSDDSLDSLHFKAWRKHAGMTQQQAAEGLGISRNYLSELERGDKRYNQDILEAMARVYGCSIGDLFRDPDAGETKWATIFDRIPSETREQAMKTAESFARDGRSQWRGEDEKKTG